MRKLSSFLLPAAAAAAVIGSLAAVASPAAADPWGRNSYRCDGDGDRCAVFHCDWDGDRCARVSEWRYRGFRPYGYGYGRYHGYRHYGYDHDRWGGYRYGGYERWR